MAGLSRPVFFMLAFAAVSAHAGGGFYPDFQKLSAALYQQMPTPAACQTGVLHEAQKQQVLSTLNAIRHLHGLAPVRYNDSEQGDVMQTALLMAVNGRIDHAQTLIQVTPRLGNPLRVSGIIADNRFYGLPNNVQFRAGQLIAGERYKVTLERVLVQGGPKTYRYWFRIVPWAATTRLRPPEFRNTVETRNAGAVPSFIPAF